MLSLESPNLGEQIRRAREQLGLSQTALAERVGISGGYLSSIESGNARPSAGKFVKLREVLNGAADEDTLETLIQKIVDKGYDVTVSRHD